MFCKKVPGGVPGVCQNKTCSPGLALNPDNGKGAAQHLGPQIWDSSLGPEWSEVSSWLTLTETVRGETEGGRCHLG